MLDPKARILVVDDFVTMRRIMRNHLRHLGYTNVAEADDGATALPMLKKEKFDLIICDWNMPRLSGLQLVEIIRQDEELKHIPFLMVTVETLKRNILKAVQAGVTNYIAKPFSRETLKRKIETIFPSLDQ
ncbi:MAG: response regulator [Deltaproteobacteria bacterium]|nr:response regulator [Deltaproteobacteria bacterium]